MNTRAQQLNEVASRRFQQTGLQSLAAPTGRNTIAQGNAPGFMGSKSVSPEGAKQSVPGRFCAAPSGLGSGLVVRFPGRCPGLACIRPSRAHYRSTHLHRRRAKLAAACLALSAVKAQTNAPLVSADVQKALLALTKPQSESVVAYNEALETAHAIARTQGYYARWQGKSQLSTVATWLQYKLTEIRNNPGTAHNRPGIFHS